VRGDVYQLKAPRDAKGHEQRGNRFAVVVQSDLLPLSTWLVAPTSTSARPASFRPEIEIEGKSTLVLVEQVAAVDPERLGGVVGHVSSSELADIDRALRIVLELA
jgi:mRNA interferase MazF